MRLAHLTPLLLVAWGLPAAGAAQCPTFVAVEEAVLTPQTPDADFGKSVDVSGDWIIVGGRPHALSGGALVEFFERAPQGWVSHPMGLAGHTVAIDGNRATASRSWLHASAYTFELSGSTWSQAPDVTYSGCPHDDFGEGIGIEGGTVAAGAPEDLATFGTVLIYDWDGAAWQERYSMYSIPDETGIRIAMDGDWVVAGGNNSATIFETKATTWDLQFVKPGSIQPGDRFGQALAVRGDTVAIGAAGVDGPAGNATGEVFLFEYDRTKNKWLRGQELVASDASAGDVFGTSLAIDGDLLLVGAPGVDGPNGTSHGAVYVFEEIAGAWTELGRFQRASAGPEVLFGTSVGLDGDRAVVGSYGVAHAFRIAAVVPPTPYCTAGTTASGCTPNVSGTGSPSASSPSGFVVDVVDLEGQKDGVIYFGTNGAQANPWGNGTSYQCVVPPVVRTGNQQGVGSLGNCDNAYSLDFSAWMAANPSKAPGAGAEVRLQCWFRDPQNTGNQTTSLSEALVFTVCP